MIRTIWQRTGSWGDVIKVGLHLLLGPVFGIKVNMIADDGLTSVRRAIVSAEAGDTIDFPVTGTVTRDSLFTLGLAA